MTAKLKLVGGRNPSLNYAPPQRINHAVPGVEWPFVETKKAEGDVVISSVGATPSRQPATHERSLASRLRALRGYRAQGGGA